PFRDRPARPDAILAARHRTTRPRRPSKRGRWQELRFLPHPAGAQGLTPLDIATAMDKLTAAGKPGAARDLRNHASTFLTWTTHKTGLASLNDMTGSPKPKAPRAERLGRTSKQRAHLRRGQKDLDRHRQVGRVRAVGPARAAGWPAPQRADHDRA